MFTAALAKVENWLLERGREDLLNEVLLALRIPYFVLSGLPMPPSSNHQYAARGFKQGNFVLAKIAPTGELNTYTDKIYAGWAAENVVAITRAREFIRNRMMTGEMVRIDRFCCFPHTDMWTQKSVPKKMDGTNRVKALDDCLAESLKIDDSYFWASYVEKIETTKAPYCIIVLKGHKPRGVPDINGKNLSFF